MRKSSSNASSRRGPSGHPGRSQRRARPASMEQKSHTTSDRESKERRSDHIEMTSGPTGNRFAALAPTVPAPGAPGEPSQSLQSDFTFRSELRRTNSHRMEEFSNPQASFLTATMEDRVLAPPPTVFPCTNKESSSKVPIVSLPTSKAPSKTQKSKNPSTFTPAALSNPLDQPPPRGLSSLHQENELHIPLPNPASASPDSEAESPLLSPSLPEDIISPEAERRFNPQPLHPSFPTSSPMTTQNHKPVAHRRLTPYPARKDAGEIRRKYPATDPEVFMVSDGKIISIAAEIAAAQYRPVTEQELAERRKFGNAARFGRPRPPIVRKGSRKADDGEGWEDEGSSGDEDEGEWELVGKEGGG
ncbi:hypothetical protein N7G274_000750 [Stereocaulon virgatum]|uniref:Uncharacterized protein n=1 Tax=Stereocaulon virgatum TaxID=373712 RepID=A0ABR4AW45_9LECA